MTERIYTRSGDDGKTDLFSGERVQKNDERVEAYGTVDELISFLGLARVQSTNLIATYILEIQQKLFKVNAELATNFESLNVDDPKHGIQKISMDDVKRLEDISDELWKALPPLSNFIIPGGSLSGSNLHVSRTVCRRAERRILTLSEKVEIRSIIIKYINP